MKVEVKPLDKGFGLYINDHLLGTTKLECDAMFHKHALEDAQRAITPDLFGKPDPPQGETEIVPVSECVRCNSYRYKKCNCPEWP